MGLQGCPRDPFASASTQRLGRWALIIAGIAVLPRAVVLAVLGAGPGFGELTELVLAGSTEGGEEASG